MGLLIQNFGKLLKILAACSLVLFVVLQLPLLLILVIFRTFVWLIAKWVHPEFDSLLSNDALIFAVYPPTQPNKSMNILISLQVDGEVTVERVQELFQENVMTKRSDNGEMVYKRLQHFWTSFLGYKFWEHDKNFLVSNHIRLYDDKDNLTIKDPCTRTDLEGMLEKLVQRPWRENQSLWEILIINNFVPENPSSKLQTIVILRMDHVLGDGYSILGFLKLLLNGTCSVPQIGQNKRSFSIWQNPGLVFKIPYDFTKDMLAMTLGAKMYGPLGNPDNVVSISSQVSVSLVKEIKNQYKVSYGAVLHSVVLGAIARAFHSADLSPPKYLQCSFPIPVPGHPGGMVIHTVSVFAELPCDAPSPSIRLYETDAILKDASKSAGGLGIRLLNRIVGCYPDIIMRHFLRSSGLSGISYMIGTFPVTTCVDYIDGMEIMDLMATVGTYASVGILINTAGTNNKHRFCFTINKDVFISEAMCKNLGTFVRDEVQALAQGLV